MSNELVFSIKTMKACNGNAPADWDYSQFFTAECVSRIEGGARQMRDLADGAGAFDSGTVARARAALAEVRRATAALDICIEWFARKPSIHGRLLEVRESVRASSEAAENDFKVTLRYFGLD